MNRFILFCCWLSCLGFFAAAAERTSIVFVMADDLGWSDLAVQGNPLISTPNLDRFANEGLRFTDAYAAAPTCSPTRAAMMTGQAPGRLHITNHMPDSERFTPKNPKILSAGCKTELALEYTTIAERLQDAGYHTAFLGKWHLSPRREGKEAFEPQHQGFDVNIGGKEWGGPPTFFDPYRNPNLPDRKAGEYLPDRLVDEANTWMRSIDPIDPFFVCLWYYTPHYPFQAPTEYLEKYKDHKGPGANNPAYAAMIEALDASFGKLIKGIEAAGRADETLVVFTSDNGGFGGGSDNRPLREAKGHLYEGGIRVPLFVQWPGVTKPGLCAEPVITMDWVPTMLAAAGLKPTRDQVVDGVDLRPLFEGGRIEPRPIYWHAPNYAWHRSNRLGSAVREGRWKLIERFDTGQLELFDVVADLSEERDLAAEQPEVTRRLAGQLREWREEVDANMPRPVKAEK